jgi:hypothetical protein
METPSLSTLGTRSLCVAACCSDRSHTDAPAHDLLYLLKWSNRAIAKMKLEEFGGAVSDASEFGLRATAAVRARANRATSLSAKAIELDPKAIKAYYRRALSQLAILQPRAAILGQSFSRGPRTPPSPLERAVHSFPGQTSRPS